MEIAVVHATEYRDLPLALLSESNTNPRRTFGPNKLAESLRTHGLIQPITVRPHNEGFEIVAGARRFRAAQIAGLDEVPVRIFNLTDYYPGGGNPSGLTVTDFNNDGALDVAVADPATSSFMVLYNTGGTSNKITTSNAKPLAGQLVTFTATLAASIAGTGTPTYKIVNHAFGLQKMYDDMKGRFRRY